MFLSSWDVVTYGMIQFSGVVASNTIKYVSQKKVMAKNLYYGILEEMWHYNLP